MISFEMNFSVAEHRYSISGILGTLADLVTQEPKPTLEPNYFDKFPANVFDYPIPHFSFWLFNFIRFGIFPEGEKNLPNENFKMVDLPAIFETENFEKFKDGEFIEDCFSKQIFLSSYFAAGEPKNNYEDKNFEIPKIFKESQPNATSLEFAHVPKQACRSKKKIIALGESL